MAEQAYAYVTLIPVAKGFQAAAAQELAGLGAVGGGIGDKAAKGFSNSFTSGLKRLIGPAVLTFATVGVTNFVKGAVTAASDLNEVGAAVDQVFGSAAGTMKQYATTASSTMGQSQTQFLNAAKTFGIFGKAAGLAGEQNASFSTEFVKLATDLASFNNTSVDTAINALGAGLRGESEPLRQFGVLLDDATLKARATEMGIYNGSGALSQQQRVLAAHAEILAQTNTQQGDFARTSDGLANSQRTLEATFADMKATVGQSLAPAFAQLSQALVPVVQQLGPVLSTVVAALMPLITALTGSIDKLIPALLPVISAVGIMAGAFGNIIASIMPALISILNIVAPLIEKFAGVFARLAEKLLPPVIKLIEQFLIPTLDFLIGIIENYALPLLERFGDILGVVLVNAINFVIAGFKLFTKILKPFWDLLKPIIDGLFKFAGIKPIKVKVAVESSGVDTTTLAGILAASGNKTGAAAVPSLTGAITSGAGSTATAAKASADAKKKMIADFRKNILDGFVENATKDPASLKTFATKINDFITDAFQNHNITADQSKAAKALVKSYTAQLEPIVAEHTKVVEALNKAQDDLTSKIEARLSYVKSITDQFSAKITTAEGTTAEQAIADLKNRLSRTKNLLSAMTQLRTLGLSGTLYQQILESGNLELAQSIIAGGSAAVTELNIIAEEANRVALELAVQAGDILFNKGIEVAKGVVDGLVAREFELNTQMVALADTFGSQLAKIVAGLTLPAGFLSPVITPIIVAPTTGITGGGTTGGGTTGGGTTGGGTNVTIPIVDPRTPAQIAAGKAESDTLIAAAKTLGTSVQGLLDSLNGQVSFTNAAGQGMVIGGNVTKELIAQAVAEGWKLNAPTGISSSEAAAALGDLAAKVNPNLDGAGAGVGTGQTIIYNAAPNVSIDSETALKSALSRSGLLA